MRRTKTMPAHDQNLHTLRQVNYSCADPMRRGAQVRRTMVNSLFKQLFLSTLIHPTLIFTRLLHPNSAIPQIFFHPSLILTQIFTTHLFLPIFFIFLLHSLILSLFTNTHTSHSHPPSSSSSSQLSNLQVSPFPRFYKR